MKVFVISERYSKGFLTNEALMIGVETRTSSPVRILRDRDTYQHVTIKGLFPCGEGAGYAGGIVSAADRMGNVARKEWRHWKSNSCQLDKEILFDKF